MSLSEGKKKTIIGSIIALVCLCLGFLGYKFYQSGNYNLTFDNIINNQFSQVDHIGETRNDGSLNTIRDLRNFYVKSRMYKKLPSDFNFNHDDYFIENFNLYDKDDNMLYNVRVFSRDIIGVYAGKNEDFKGYYEMEYQVDYD